MSTLVIVPAYNEEDSIEATIDELITVAPDLDYLVVNDGSRDRTRQICEQRGYNIVSHPVNLGLTGAFQTGMKYAHRNGYECAIQFDADGQHMPAYIGQLVDTMRDRGADIVIGSRFVTEGKPRSLRMLGSNMISAIIALTTGAKINDPTSGMRLYNRRMIEQFATRGDLSPEPDTLAFLIRKKDAHVEEVQVSMRERTAGESYLTLSKSIIYMATAFTSILFAQWFRR
ncbi:MAG: glycosyltransferase family 2 protein [Collinsella sp.]|nr:glycosyltransferase family 2 protein [Collinsella sp.]